MPPDAACPAGPARARASPAPFRYARIAVRRARVERHEALLAAFAQDPRHPGAQIDVFEIESRHLAQPKPRRVEQLEDRAIPAPERRIVGGGRDERRHLLLGEMGRHPDFALGRGHQRARVVVDERLAAQIAQERAHGRELARGGRPRLPVLVKRADELRMALPIERAGPQLARLHGGAGGRVREKLRQIAFVRAHRVRRRVAIEPEKLEKRLQMRGHRSGTVSKTVPCRCVAGDGLQAVPPPIEVGERALGDAPASAPACRAGRRRAAP